MSTEVFQSSASLIAEAEARKIPWGFAVGFFFGVVIGCGVLVVGGVGYGAKV